MDTTEVVVVRYGETVWNQEASMQGHLDSPLNAAGVAHEPMDDCAHNIWRVCRHV